MFSFCRFCRYPQDQHSPYAKGVFMHHSQVDRALLCLFGNCQGENHCIFHYTVQVRETWYKGSVIAPFRHRVFNIINESSSGYGSPLTKQSPGSL